MEIAVCVKAVPDYDMVLPKDFQQWEGAAPDVSYAQEIFGCFDETALELALRLKENLSCVTLSAVSVGDPSSLLRGLYAVGYEKVCAVKPASDVGTEAKLDFAPHLTAAYLAGYFRQHPADLILCGRQTGPGDSGLVPYLLARSLGISCIPSAVGLKAVKGKEANSAAGKGADASQAEECMDAVGETGDQASIAVELADGTICQMKGPSVVIIDNVADCFLRIPTLKEKLAAKKKAVTEVQAASCSGGESDGAFTSMARLLPLPRREKCAFFTGTPREQAAALLQWLKEHQPKPRADEKMPEEKAGVQGTCGWKGMSQEEQPEIFLLEDSPQNRMIAVQMREILGGSCLFQVRELLLSEDEVYARRRAYSSNVQADYRLCLPAVMTVQGGSGTGEETLEDAGKIVAAGRGIESRANFHKLQACAAQMGAMAGCTRPVAMNAWAPVEALIGQSGHQVSPDWMVTVGASGSAPFLSGIRTEHLAAVDRDPDAKIFWNAEVGIVADTETFLDALAEELRS